MAIDSGVAQGVLVSNAFAPGAGGLVGLFDSDSSTTDKALGLLSGGLSSIFGGGKDKPKPWAKLPGGRNQYRGNKLLAAYNALLPGTLDITRKSSEGFGDIYRAEAEKTRAEDLSSFQKYGPAYAKAISEADPYQAELRSLINGIMIEELQAGGDLSPSQMRLAEQSTRTAQAARGLGYGRGDSLREVLGTLDYSRGLKNERLANAIQVGNFNQRVVGDPFMAFSGRPSQPQGSNVMAPQYSNFNNDLSSFMANDEMMAFNAGQNSKNRTSAMVGAGIGALGSIAGGAMLCWVARAVYGEENPLWLKFRDWLTTKAPEDVRDLYIAVGPKLAERVTQRPKLKAALRRFMDAKIQELQVTG